MVLYAIFLHDSANSSMNPWTFQKILVLFTDGYIKESEKNTLKSLKLVKETPKTCKVERVKYSKKHPIK